MGTPYIYDIIRLRVKQFFASYGISMFSTVFTK